VGDRPVVGAGRHRYVVFSSSLLCMRVRVVGWDADESSTNSMDFIPITKADGPLEYGWDLERRVSAGAHGEEIVRGFWADGHVSCLLLTTWLGAY
jgi:hypothetical protein